MSATGSALRSLQVKFSALLVALLVVACVSLALVATKNERDALETEVAERGRSLARSLARGARGPLLEIGQPDSGAALRLEQLVESVGSNPGVVAARVLDRAGSMLVSLDPEEPSHGETRKIDRAAGDENSANAERREDRLTLSAPVLDNDVPIGEAQVTLDLGGLVESVIDHTTRQLSIIALTLIGVGVVAGTAFVALLVGPLRRLRRGVEQLRDGDLTVRVPPTSRDEVGELTRAFNEMGDSLQQKQRIQNAFGRYVNDYVLNQLLEGPEEEALAGIEREVTILFCDIRGFTHLSEGMKARDVVGLLHEILQLVSDRILASEGTIDKFMGDSVMAYFGAPVQQDDHALRSVTAATEILKAVAERNARVAAHGTDSAVPVEVGVGIHTGTAVLGNIGSDRRTDFTAVGDAGNVAHRLEKLAGPGEILVSEAVQRAVRAEYRLRFEGERVLSGREEPVHVYAVDRERYSARGTDTPPHP